MSGQAWIDHTGLSFEAMSFRAAVSRLERERLQHVLLARGDAGRTGKLAAQIDMALVQYVRRESPRPGGPQLLHFMFVHSASHADFPTGTVQLCAAGFKMRRDITCPEAS
jgi:hypothetical protein